MRREAEMDDAPPIKKWCFCEERCHVVSKGQESNKGQPVVQIFDNWLKRSEQVVPSSSAPQPLAICTESNRICMWVLCLPISDSTLYTNIYLLFPLTSCVCTSVPASLCWSVRAGLLLPEVVDSGCYRKYARGQKSEYGRIPKRAFSANAINWLLLKIAKKKFYKQWHLCTSNNTFITVI
jgi:hypothetical protein